MRTDSGRRGREEAGFCIRAFIPLCLHHLVIASAYTIHDFSFPGWELDVGYFRFFIGEETFTSYQEAFMQTLRKRGLWLGWLLIALLVVLSACGANTPVAQDPTTAPTTAPEPTVAPTPTEVSRAVRALDSVQSAVVQIEAQGTFVSPDAGLLYNTAGRGSGFIIDESGIAVTNNHVVTGAALLKVYVNGESRPRNARVLGVSECSDLAVIDIDGEGYPYLEWYSDEIKVGLDVFAAGYPLGDPEFTLTRGIISKARADGETSWASVDNVLEHDATINPGNSGGPLVTSDGKVVGVNYAGASATNQYFAISRNEAEALINILRTGEDVTSLGINGEAFVAPDDSFSGIWAWSVKSGSPADRAGVKPGDIVTQLERLMLATDGTMTSYCDILRSHDADDTLQLEVLRNTTQQVLEGQINGRVLEETFSFATNDDVPVADTGVRYEEYYTFAEGGLRVDLPQEWSDTGTGTWTSDGNEIPASVALTAAPSIDGFINTWDVPGMFLGASRQLVQEMTVAELLDRYAFDQSCTYAGRDNYSDATN
jgi:serine protease Do